LSTPYSDAFTVGFQREIAPEVSLGVTLIHVDYKNQLQDIDVNHYTLRDPVTGQFVDELGDEVLAAALGKKAGPVRVKAGIADLSIRTLFFKRIFSLRD